MAANSSVVSLLKHRDLLRQEYEFDRKCFAQQSSLISVEKKVAAGNCRFPVALGRSYYNSLNQLVIEITRTEDTDIEHSFEFGRPICFFRQSTDGKIIYMNFTATVSYVDDTRMVAVMPGAATIMEVQAADNLGVQLYFDETSYRTMFEALEDTLHAKGNRLAELRDTLLPRLMSGELDVSELDL